MTFPNHLRQYRQKAGLTQTEVARRVRIAPSHVSAIEAGRAMPWPKLRRALSRILKTSQRELFPENGGGQIAKGANHDQ